jgi:hypothetical protein
MTDGPASPGQASRRTLKLIEGFGAVLNWSMIVWGAVAIFSGLIQLSWVIIVFGFVFLALGLLHRTARTMKDDDIAEYQALQRRSRGVDES